MGEGNGGAFDGAFDGVVDAAVSSGLEERPSEFGGAGNTLRRFGEGEADDDIVGSATVIRRRRGGMSDAAVSGIDDDIGGKEEG